MHYYAPMHKPSLNSHDPGRVLRLHMEGVDHLDGDVRLGSFIDKLAALKAALAETEHLLSGRSTNTVDFVVSELSHSSPAMVGLRAIQVGSTNTAQMQDPTLVLSEFMTFLGGVRARTIGVDSDRAKLVGHLRKLVTGVGEKFERLWLEGPNFPTIHLDIEVAKALDDALPDVRREQGSVKGVVKRYSGVGKQPYFKIVPPIGGVEIKCVFAPHMLALAATAVERNATVEGELKYYEDDLWPHEVHVKTIAVHLPDLELPTLMSLLGTEPDATGDLSVDEYVREQRNEW